MVCVKFINIDSCLTGFKNIAVACPIQKHIDEFNKSTKFYYLECDIKLVSDHCWVAYQNTIRIHGYGRKFPALWEKTYKTPTMPTEEELLKRLMHTFIQFGLKRIFERYRKHFNNN